MRVILREEVLEELRRRVAGVEASGPELSRALVELAAETCVLNHVGLKWQELPGRYQAADWFAGALARLVGKRKEF